MQDPPSVPFLLSEYAGFATAVSELVASTDPDWHMYPGQEEWSLTEVMCHLRDVEKEVHQVRYQKILASENVFLSGENADVWVEQRGYRHQDGRAALADFMAARAENVALLKGIEDEMIWERVCRHALFGMTSLHELLNLAVRHDRAHWEQINRLVKG